MLCPSKLHSHSVLHSDGYFTYFNCQIFSLMNMIETISKYVVCELIQWYSLDFHLFFYLGTFMHLAVSAETNKSF